MAETFAEYVARIEGEVEGRDRLRVLRATPGSLGRKIRGVARARLARPPEKGKWSAGEILAHLCDTELLWAFRIRKILEDDEPVLQGMDEARWATILGYRRFHPAESLELFRALRKRNLSILLSLTPRELRRTGLHTQFGKLSIDRIKTLMAGHDINHSRQIDRTLTRKARD